MIENIRKFRLFQLLFLVNLFYCTSDPVIISKIPSEDAEKLSRVEGSSCGLLGSLGGTAYYFIPIALNSRVENAYAEALSKAPGARSLINVSISENWYWIVLGHLKCFKVSGDAVK